MKGFGWCIGLIRCRLAICVERKRSSAMGKCRRAHIASITRPNVYLPRSRRRGTPQRGKTQSWAVGFVARAKSFIRAKYIEGLENRLGRMESLLKLSGLLSDEDGDKTDLGTLEKRLADKSMSNEGTPPRSSNRSGSANQPRASTESHHSTHRLEVATSPRSSMTSPESQKGGEEEVEALSDMMCSLVTNNCGETRYIGK